MDGKYIMTLEHVNKAKVRFTWLERLLNPIFQKKVILACGALCENGYKDLQQKRKSNIIKLTNSLGSEEEQALNDVGKTQRSNPGES